MTPSGALLKAMLINSAVDMKEVAGYPNDLEGWGVIRWQPSRLEDRSMTQPGAINGTERATGRLPSVQLETEVPE